MAKKIPDEILRCPKCGQAGLKSEKNQLRCPGCGKVFETVNGSAVFVRAGSADVSDSLDKIKYFLKRYRKFYQLLISLASPVYVSNRLGRFVHSYMNQENGIYLNLGSGNSDISPLVSNVDIFAYENVNLVCDISQLPVSGNSVDAIVNQAVLEHVPEPARVVAEIERVLKPGGVVYCVFPFIQGFHASPHDYSRVTRSGLAYLFRNFEIIRLENAGGPTSGFLWILQEWLAILLSFGSRKLHMFWFLFFMLLTFPLKYLDIVLARYPAAENISSAFVLVARKK